MFNENSRINRSFSRQTPTLVRFDNDPILSSNQNPVNHELSNPTTQNISSSSSSPSSFTKIEKPMNYIQGLFIENFEEQRQRYYSHPDHLQKLFIFPYFTEIPKAIENANTINKRLPLSIFYHSDKYLKKCLSKLKNLRIAITPKFQQKYIKWSREVLKAQKTILFAIFLIYSQTKDYNIHSRYYRLWIPGGGRHLAKNYYSEYVLFAAQALLSGLTLPKLEEYSNELRNRALDLYSSLNTLYQVFYHRMELSLNPPYTDLIPYLNDFDKFWLLFEKRLYTCYHNIYHINKIKNTQIISGFQKFMIKTLVYSIKKNYFTLDMAYEYDPLIMMTLPRLTFVYIIYHLSNPFFFSNFPWFSKERYADIDKINQTFNLLNRKSIEKLEYYLIHGIPTTNNHSIKRKSSLSPKKPGEKNSVLSNPSEKLGKGNVNLSNNIYCNLLNQQNSMKLSSSPLSLSPSSPLPPSTKTHFHDTSLKIVTPNHNLPTPLSIPNTSHFEPSHPSSSTSSASTSSSPPPFLLSTSYSHTPSPLSIEAPYPQTIEKDTKNKDEDGNDLDPLKLSEIVDKENKGVKSPLSCSPSSTLPENPKDIHCKFDMVDGEGGVGSPKEEEDWSFNNDEEEDEGGLSATSSSSSSSSSNDEDEVIGDILVRKVFKSVCMIVDEFQSSEVARKLNEVMKNVFRKGIEKIESMKEEEEKEKEKEKEKTTEVPLSNNTKHLATTNEIIQNQFPTQIQS